MIVRSNSKLDRLLWHVGLSWFQRQRIRLWLHFLPKRIACAFDGHYWGKTEPVVSDGPLHLPPSEREWYVHALHTQCDRCAKIRSEEPDPDKFDEYIAHFLAESEEEWADPNTRATLEAL
jgi:hypothetical protein